MNFVLTSLCVPIITREKRKFFLYCSWIKFLFCNSISESEEKGEILSSQSSLYCFWSMLPWTRFILLLIKYNNLLTYFTTQTEYDAKMGNHCAKCKFSIHSRWNYGYDKLKLIRRSELKHLTAIFFCRAIAKFSA